MADISKITLPSGNTYNIKDEVARQAIAGGVSFKIVWTKAQYEASTAPSASVLAEIPAVTVYYNNGASSTTGTLAANDQSTVGTFYLVYSKAHITSDVFEEYVAVGDTGSKAWEKIGEPEVSLSGVVTGVTLTKDTATVLKSLPTITASKPNVTITGGTTDKVLGEGTTFTNSSSSVTFGTHTTETVLKSDVTATVPKPSYTVNYLTAAAGNVPSTATSANTDFLKGVSVSNGTLTIGAAALSNPAITLTASTSNSTGAVKVVKEAGTSGTDSVTFNTSGHTASAITALGAATAAAQAITVGTNDKVTAVTGVGTAALDSAPTISVGNDATTETVLKGTTSINVTTHE